MTSVIDVVVGLGSNIDAAKNIVAAVEAISHVCDLVAVSTIYSSEPVGRSDLPTYLNGVAAIRTSLSQAELKQALLDIESDLGRVRNPRDRNQARPIDLDIVVYDAADCRSSIFVDGDLEKRWFVAVPAAELWPDWHHPRLGVSLSEIANRLSPQIDGEPVTLEFGDGVPTRR